MARAAAGSRPGETRTYAQIAAAVGRPAAVRAAGSANGANNVAVLIPCHRVIRTDGTLGGYAYGLERKARLLERERRRRPSAPLALALLLVRVERGLEPVQHFERGFVVLPPGLPLARLALLAAAPLAFRFIAAMGT